MTNTKPLVSLGFPVYNGERFIREALDSLLSQTYMNLEIVISDNASTDNTEAICRRYVATDQRIRYHRSPVNQGVVRNFCRVFELSSGDYFTWTAADDIRPRTSIEDLAQALLTNQHAVMAHGPVLVKAEGRDDLVEVTNEAILSSPETAARIRAFTRGIRHNAILYGLYRRDAFGQATLEPGWGHDYLFCLQMCFLGPVEYVRAPMIVYRERRAIPSSNPMYRDEPLKVADLLTLRRKRIRRGKSWRVLVMGCYYFLRIPGTSFRKRLQGVSAYAASFTWHYRKRLAKEIVYQLFIPAAWLALLCWRLARERPLSSRVARKLRTMLSRV